MQVKRLFLIDGWRALWWCVDFFVKNSIYFKLIHFIFPFVSFIRLKPPSSRWSALATKLSGCFYAR